MSRGAMVTVLPDYQNKADVLSDAQTVALAGCGSECPKSTPHGIDLCHRCNALFVRLLCIAAHWNQKARQEGRT